MSFYEFLGVPVFYFSCDFHSDYEFLGVPVFYFSCDFYDNLHSMYGDPTNSNLSKYHRQSKKICE
jgi:hypothetical protein